MNLRWLNIQNNRKQKRCCYSLAELTFPFFFFFHLLVPPPNVLRARFVFGSHCTFISRSLRSAVWNTFSSDQLGVRRFCDLRLQHSPDDWSFFLLRRKKFRSLCFFFSDYVLRPESQRGEGGRAGHAGESRLCVSILSMLIREVINNDNRRKAASQKRETGNDDMWIVLSSCISRWVKVQLATSSNESKAPIETFFSFLKCAWELIAQHFRKMPFNKLGNGRRRRWFFFLTFRNASLGSLSHPVWTMSNGWCWQMHHKRRRQAHTKCSLPTSFSPLFWFLGARWKSNMSEREKRQHRRCGSTASSPLTSFHWKRKSGQAPQKAATERLINWNYRLLKKVITANYVENATISLNG